MLAEFLSLYESLALYQTIVFGLVLILVVIFLPDGLVSLPEKISLSSWGFEGREKASLQ
jgi:ABC-type branched-subunit amino acid transport system permease subunit